MRTLHSIVPIVLAAFLLAFPGDAAAQQAFVRGDANGDGIVSMADPVRILSNLFRAGPELGCLAASDANMDDGVNIADAVYVIMHVSRQPGAPPIRSAEEYPPLELDCAAGLAGSPDVDSGMGASMDEVVAAEGEVLVPVRIWSPQATIDSWAFTVSYPAHELEFVRMDAVSVPGVEEPDFMSAEVQEPGIVRICTLYHILLEPDHGLDVNQGTKLCDLAFNPVGHGAARAVLGFAQEYGESEVVAGTLSDMPGEAIFPATWSGAVSFDDDPLPAPSDLQANVTEMRTDGTGAEVHLSWSNGAAYESVLVERTGERGIETIAELAGTATTFDDMAPSGHFGYRVRGRQGAQESIAPFALISTIDLLPEPHDVGVAAGEPNQSILAWKNPVAYDAVQIFRNGTLIAELPGSATDFTDTERDGPIAVYHLRGQAGQHLSRRVPALLGASSSPDYGEDRVQNLTCRFTDPGEVALSWDPPENPENPDAYEVWRGETLLATLEPSATSLADNPPFERNSLDYRVFSIIGESQVAATWCRIPFRRHQSIRNLGATLSGDFDTITLRWDQGASYLAITVSRNDELVATLPGDANEYTETLDFGSAESITYSVHAIGSDFMTDPKELTVSHSDQELLRGDANWDGRTSMSDVLLLRRHLFNGAIPPLCPDAADANDDGGINIADPVMILQSIFTSDVTLPAPYPAPGIDFTGDSLTCEAGELIPGEFTNDELRVGEVEAVPGQEVGVPVYLTNHVPVEAFQLVIRYNPQLFILEDGYGGTENAALDFTDTAFDRTYDGRVPDFAGLHAPDGQDYFVAGALWSIIEDIPVLPGENQLLVTIVGRVSADAEPGQIIELTPTNGVDNDGTGIHRLMNEITSKGESRFVSFHPKTKAGFIDIKDNSLGMNFLRGDMNADGHFNLADPIATLMYLFADSSPPPCPDTADADDSGEIEVNDAVLSLTYLFVAADLPPDVPLTGQCEPDKTYDHLGDCLYTHCRK